jgi:SAM-dependent methyltransferase
MTEESAGPLPAWLRARAEVYARHPLVRRPTLRARFARFSAVQPSDAVLDVGTGPGYSAFAFARRAASVSAVDWRPELLAAARRQASRRRFQNIAFVEAQPGELPFPDSSFDIVACAAAVHHFRRPAEVIAEMARVCRFDGSVVIEDVVTSEQDVRARYHNRLERLRDRSHERLLKLSELIAIAGQAGLVTRKVEVHDSVREFSEWVAVTRPPLRRSEQLRHLLQGAVEHDLTGLEVEAGDDTFFFVQRVAWVQFLKPA